jgi:DNA-binding response OmpR family regulator
MIIQVSESALVTRPQDPLPAFVVDVREPGGVEAAVQGALQAAGLRQEMVAIVLIPLGATPASTLARISDLAPKEAGDGLMIDVRAHEVFLHGQPVPLTAREFALLHYLYERRGAVVSRKELLRDVWGESYGGGARTVDIHVRRLRAKLGAAWFETIRGVGYKFRRRE